MKIHHLNCGTLYPLFQPHVQSIIYCLLVEIDNGLLLVDTGFGIQDYQQPTRFVKLFIASLGMKKLLDETAGFQVEKLGYSRSDVKHIVMTHMHCDHAGGLRDFPDAKVHIYSVEYDAIHKPKGLKERFYEPAHWAHGPKWAVYSSVNAQDWYGFSSIPVNISPSQDVRLIPLPGHTRGHCGVAVKSAEHWFLHCGDATYPFYHKNEPLPPYKPLPGYVMSPPRWLENSLVGKNTTRLRELHKTYGNEITLICSNDLISYSIKQHQFN